MKLEGLYGVYHLIYLIVSLGITIGALILIKKKVTKKETLRIIFKVTAALLLIAIITNRISTTYYRIYVTKTSNTWWGIFPDSICGASSLLLSISVLISSKKNNPIYYFVVYLGFLGAIITVFYPDFLTDQSFSLLNSWTGLLHHSIMLFLVLLIVTEGYLTPSLKKVYIAAIGYMCFIIYGLFNISIFNIRDSMNIRYPLVSSLKVMTSWYMVGIMFTLFVLIISLIYEHRHSKHKKTI